MLSVGALQLACFFAFSNLGMQSLPAGRSSVLAYTASLWVVPLSLLIGEKVGWRAFAGRAAGRRRHRRAGRSAALRLDDQRRDLGPCLAAAGGLHLGDRHRPHPPPPLAHRAARRAALADDAWPPCCSGSSPRSLEPNGHLDVHAKELWIGLIYIGAFAGPIATWAAVSVNRALPPVVGSMAMLGVPLLSIASSVVLVDEPITLPLAIGTALVIAGIAIVILEKSRPAR